MNAAIPALQCFSERLQAAEECLRRAGKRWSLASHTPPSANNNPGGGQANGHGEVRGDHFDVNYSIPVSPQPSV